MSESLGKINYFEKKAPSVVVPAFRLKDGLFALESMLEGDIPRRSPIMLSKSEWVSYVIGDTSGNGYGAAVHMERNCMTCMGSEFQQRASKLRIIESCIT